MTKAIIMGLEVEPKITDMSQSNRGTQWHHLPYPVSHGRIRGVGAHPYESPALQWVPIESGGSSWF